MSHKKRRPQPGGDCGASESVLPGGFDVQRGTPPETQMASAPAPTPVTSQNPAGAPAMIAAPTETLVAADAVADLRFRRRVERLHRLGPRAVGELLAELGAELSITSIIDQKLDTYADLDAEDIEATGGNRFWPLPLREVRP